MNITDVDYARVYRLSNFAKGGTIYNEELINGYEWDVSNQDHKKLPNRAIRFNKKNNRYELYNYTNNETDYSYSDLDDLVRNVNNIMGETFSTNYEAKKDGSQLYDELEYGKMAKGGSVIGIQDPYELENQGNRYLESQGIDAKKFGVVHYDGFGKNSKLLKDVKGKDDEGNLNPLWMYERTPETKSMTKGFQRGKKIYEDGGRLGDIKFDVEEVARQFDAIDSDGTKYEGEVINPLSKSEKNQIIKAIKNIVEKVDGRFSDIVVDDFTNEEIYINLIFDNDVYDNSPQDIILYRKTFELNNSDESYIDHRYLYESGYKYANGGNLDGFDETWNKFKENTREAFGQPRNRKVVSLESDFGYRKSELPQLRTKDKPMFVKSLISKYGANVVTEGLKVKASQLKPIQNEINLEQVEVISNVSKGKMNPNKPITISQDGYVIDGHHRWYYAKQNDLKLSVLQINLNAMQVIDEIWQSGLAKKEDISSVRMKQGGQLN